MTYPALHMWLQQYMERLVLLPCDVLLWCAPCLLIRANVFAHVAHELHLVYLQA
jgi:hypothetical protein